MKISKILDFSDKTTLITGATGNLGVKLSETFADLGSDLILVDLYKNKLNNLSRSLSEHSNSKINYFVCDLSKEKERKKLISSLKNQQIDTLINNAAFTGEKNFKGWNEKFKNQSVNAWRECLEINLISIFHLTQGIFKNLEMSKNSKVVNVGSIYAHIPPDWSIYENTDMTNPAAYGASKAALLNLTQWLSTLSKKVRINSVSPGGILRNQPKKFIQRYENKTSLGRMAYEEDIVGVIIFLSSDLSNYVTGQDIRVDGGFF
tara:strand:- start:11764 stop:12549 length:786 start_codon:yes stop_codon:yes gene_type:complete